MAYLIESAFDYRSLFGITVFVAPWWLNKQYALEMYQKGHGNLCVSIDLRRIFPWPLFGSKFDFYLALSMAICSRGKTFSQICLEKGNRRFGQMAIKAREKFMPFLWDDEDDGDDGITWNIWMSFVYFCFAWTFPLIFF